MTTSATKIVSATDNTNRNNNNSSSSNNSCSNSDDSSNTYKIVNNSSSSINTNHNNSHNIITTPKSDYVTLKTPVASQAQITADACIQPDTVLVMPTAIKLPSTTTTTATTALVSASATTTTSVIGKMEMLIPTTPSGLVNGPNLSVICPTTIAGNSSTARAMQSDEDFNIRFVNLVRLHKCLYDKKVPEYRNRDNQEKAWSLISQETRESVIHCKERWRNLRACLSRYIKQQSGTDPQHKPYYLTEHMSFLLPFLKSTRSNGSISYCLDMHQQLNNNHGLQDLSALFPLSAPQTAGGVNQLHLPPMTMIPITNGVSTGDIEIKHSPSENHDEDTIDAFDPAVTATLQQHHHHLLQFPPHPQATLNYHEQQQQLKQRMSPTLSDTASANSLQHFIPDVQLSEAPSSDYNHIHNHEQQHPHMHENHHNGARNNHMRQTHTPTPLPHDPKRIKLECDGINERICSCGFDNTVLNNPDMEFFRSILPDIAFLSAQQKRKLKIGILELIDDVVARYPAQTTAVTTPANISAMTSTPLIGHVANRQRNVVNDRRK